MKNKKILKPLKKYLNLTLDISFKAFFKDKSVSIPFLHKTENTRQPLRVS